MMEVHVLENNFVIDLEHLRSRFGGRLSEEEALAKYTTFRIGGVADVYAEPASVEDVLALMEYLRENHVPHFVMGNGSNVLISDEGIRGVVINLEQHFAEVTIENGVVTAGAGVKLSKLVDAVITGGFSGAEMLAGIPGTLGGAVMMNAGAYGGEISDYMTLVDVVRSGTFMRMPREECGFRYRNSSFTRNDIVLGARFKFPAGEKEELARIRKELLLKRNAAQPVNFPNAGSIFKNPERMFAAKLIEECGLKNRRAGGAMISELHANFIVNVDHATAHDVLALVRIARARVKEKFSIMLELEVKPVGFTLEEIADIVTL